MTIPPTDAVVVPVRSEPVQPRAAARVEALLDAAAVVVEAVGSEQLTTAMVAQRSGASIGTVYRYFPDRIAVLVALAGRNLERLRHRFERVLRAEHATWLDALIDMFHEFVAAYRDIPSFRSIRTGDMLDLGREQRVQSTPIVADDTISVLSAQYGLPDDESAKVAILRAFTVVDALVMFAFQRNRFGDEEVLEMALEHGISELVAVFGDPRT